jgi:hypothetical protein
MANRGGGYGGLDIPPWVGVLIAIIILIAFLAFCWSVAGDQILKAFQMK